MNQEKLQKTLQQDQLSILMKQMREIQKAMNLLQEQQGSSPFVCKTCILDHFENHY
jgi:hypothetical protein